MSPKSLIVYKTSLKDKNIEYKFKTFFGYTTILHPIYEHITNRTGRDTEEHYLNPT